MWYHTWPPDVFGGTYNHRSAWPEAWPNVNLTQSLIFGWGYMWPEVSLTKFVTHLAIKCLYWGGGYIWPQVYVIKVVTHLASRCLCLWEGQVDILSVSQPASQLSSCNWPANQPCDKISTCQAVGWSDSWWQEDRGPNHIGPSVQGPSTLTASLWGNDLPDQGQASDTNELCSPLYTVGTTFRDCLQFWIYIT